MPTPKLWWLEISYNLFNLDGLNEDLASVLPIYYLTDWILFVDKDYRSPDTNSSYSQRIGKSMSLDTPVSIAHV